MSITPSTVYPDESFTIKVAVTPVPEVETSVRVGRSPFHTYVWIPLDPTTGKGEMTLVSDQLYAFFPLGTYDLTGSFEGTPHHDASSSSPVPFTVRVDEPTIVATTTDGPVHVGEPVTFYLSVTPVPTADGAQAGFLLFPPPASYSRGPVLIDLGVDGSGETTVDTDGWYAGEYGYRAICCSDPHIEQTEIQGSFTLIDEDPPTGTAEFFGDDVVMSNRLSVHVPAADGIGSGVNWVALSNDAVTWTEMPYFETVPWTLEPGDGVRTVFVKWRDQAGNWSEVASASVTVDTGTGLVTTPQAGVLSSNLETGLVPTKLGWSGGTGAGPVSFRVEKSKDGGAYALVKDGVGSTSLTSSLSPGHSYRFRVRAVGQASDAGQWSYGTTFKLTAVSQASSAVRYRGAWTGSSGSKWWGGSVKSSSSKGSTASYTFTGKKIAWVSLKAANRGKAQVYVNGVLKATVDLYSKTTQQQRIVWSANYPTSAKRTITIKVLGTSGRPRVDVDGFIVGS